MLGFLCSRPKPLLFPVLVASSFHRSLHRHAEKPPPSFARFPSSDSQSRRRHHSSSCLLRSSDGSTGGCPAVVSIWHGILPSSGGISARSRRAIVGRLVREEGSWNVAWDARPARWLHGSNSAWLLFGVCSCFLPFDLPIDGRDDGVSSEKETGGSEAAERESGRATTPSLLPHAAAAELAQAPPYKVTGVSGDGRCLFRAVAYGDCLRNGKAAPDEALQKELADDLRARVANELLKRREETEWFIEGDFESYVKNIQQPHAWGGEPELLMASHVLQKPISVFMMDGNSGDLVSIASYGQEYRKGNSPITVLFHGYGHYDALEVF
ncbi:OTU domain-containing protein [Nymphaea thermarum]|nr:OTU domain-containing protein [Nymphaea thermarum]